MAKDHRIAAVRNTNQFELNRITSNYFERECMADYFCPTTYLKKNLPLHLPLHSRYSMTRVVPDQKSKFESDELFRKLSRESEIRFTAYRDRTHEERIARFQAECREGRCQISFSASGTNLVLYLGPQNKDKKLDVSKEFVNFDKEPGKVHLKSNFLMNGVCVVFRGIIDLQRLDGTAYLEHDAVQAKVEDKMLRETIDQSRIRIKEFEEHQRRIKQEPLGEHDLGQGGFISSDYHSMMAFQN